MSTTNFYRAFEERFYAPRNIIKELREQYLPYIQPLSAIFPGAATFDVGCGRGEWLELMLTQGFKPVGVDLDVGMLQACAELGLPAIQGDAVDYLQTLPDESQAVVSAFHVVEHISFDQLQTLVMEALRTLKPGGLLIMETPNPENVAVATRNFYLDPTHIKPIPPMLLGFLPEFHGFARISTLRMQEPRDIHERSDITLTDVLHHVSPDYAIVAQKSGPPALMGLFDPAFSASTGVDLYDLADRFDARQAELLTAHHDTRQALYATQEQIKIKFDQLQSDAQALKEQFQTLQSAFTAAQSEHTNMRQERDFFRQERDSLFNERETLRHEYNALIQAQGAVVRERDALTYKRDAVAHERNALTHERDGLTHERDAVVHERNALTHERNALTHERDAIVHERNALVHERDTLLQERSAILTERDGLRLERDALRNSLSWKVTAPLRSFGGFAASPISFTMAKVLKNPRLSERINRVVIGLPSLHARLRTSAINQGLMTENIKPEAPPSIPISYGDLSPRAQKIRDALEKEMARLKA